MKVNQDVKTILESIQKETDDLDKGWNSSVKWQIQQKMHFQSLKAT